MNRFAMLLFAALSLAASVVRAEVVYGYDEPAAVTPHAEEVIVGDEGVPAGVPMTHDYGCAPSWSGGCCERVASPADHLWDDYCCERHSGWWGWHGCGGCCGRSFGDCGFQKDCHSQGCLSRLHLPHFHLPRLNCSQKCAPKCAAPKCTTSKCGSKCGHGLCLANFRLFRGCGLAHGGKCGKGCKGGATVIEAPAVQETNDVPMPNMPSEEPPAPPMPNARAA
jgi:hypothetical protein